MQRLQTLTTKFKEVFITQDMDECFTYNDTQICRKDLVKPEDLKTHHTEPIDLVKIDDKPIELLVAVDANTQPDCCGFMMPSADNEGSCSAANPYVPMTVAPFVLVFNIFGCGIGTLVASYYTPGGCSYKVMCCGIF